MSDNYYELLGINKGANENEIKKAYKQAAMKNHPDKGGDETKFKQINEAYSVLSDSEKRNIYDKFGKKGLESNGRMPGGMDPMDIFSSMFGGHPMHQRHQHHGVRKSNDISNVIEISLEDIYNGKTKEINIERTIYDKSKEIKCNTCGGRGMVTQVVRMGPMVTQSTGPCPHCRGVGASIDKVHLTKVKERISLNIPIGCPDGHKIRIHNKTNMEPGKELGDLIFIVKYKKHKHFSVHKNGVDLLYTAKINLHEALSGFVYRLDHLDGTSIEFKNEKIMKPNTVLTLLGEGLFNNENYGNLHIKFYVDFPSQIHNGTNLESILSQCSIERITNRQIRKVELSKYKCSSHEDKTKEEYSDRGGVECAQQ